MSLAGLPARVWLALFLALCGGCIVAKGDGACGPHQQRVRGDSIFYCACESGYVLDADKGTCTACGEHEQTVNGKCVCAAGYARSAADAPCETSLPGASCTSDANCVAPFGTCVVTGKTGYCTAKGCASSSDCEIGYLCDKTGSTSLCKKAPSGYRESCKSSADCKKDATFCDTFKTHSCLVPCSESEPCPGDWTCCDITVGNVALCIEPAGLADGGVCPLGGMPVSP